MADVLTVADLELAKKHDTFHSEVITGRAGGSASGAEIDTATNAVTGQVQTTLPKVLRDVGFKPASFNFITGGTLGAADADKCIYNPAPAGDGNWYSWGGVLPHTVAPGADPTSPSSGYVPRTDVTLRAEITPSITESLRRSYAEAGYNLVDGSFEVGGTVNKVTDVLLHKADGKAYFWTGSLPHSSSVAPPGSGWVSTDDVFDILITYGQSNAVGFAAGQGSTPTTLEGRGNITPLGYYWNGSAVAPLIYDMVQSSGEKSTGNAWVPFANEYCKRTGRNLVVIPCAKGATSIADLQKGGQWYTAMTAYVTNCITSLQSSGKYVGKRWLGFHQGEADQLAFTSETDYTNALVQLKNDTVADFSLNKFVIHYVGYPQNRQERSWDYIIGIQRRLNRSYKDVVCGFDTCASFTQNNGMLTSDAVHYSQLGFNLMGSTSGKVVAGLVIDDKTDDYEGDEAYTGLKFPKDRFWNFIHVGLRNVSGTWVIVDRAVDSASHQKAVSNVKEIVSVTADQINIRTAQTNTEYLSDMRALTSFANRELGIHYEADYIGTDQIGVRCLIDFSFVVKTDGTIASHTGNPLNPILAQYISASYNGTTQNWTVTFLGNLSGAAIVTPFGIGSNATLISGTGTVLTVNCPSGDSNKSFAVKMDNVRANFTQFTNMGTVSISAIGGQASW